MATVLLVTLSMTLSVVTVIWLIHVALRDAGLIDFYWGLGFPLIGWTGLAIGGAWSFPAIAFMIAVTAWGVRLTWQLAARHYSLGKDARYEAMRRRGGERFWWRSLFSVFLLQGVILWLTASPVLAVAALPADAPGVAALVGYLVFLLGLGVETLADRQLARHRSGQSGRKEVLSRGLWAWCRHPNYAGEVVLWFGLAMVAFDLTGAWLSFAGPCLLFLVIRFVSMPITEEHLRHNRPGYRSYCQRVPALLPTGTRKTT